MRKASNDAPAQSRPLFPVAPGTTRKASDSVPTSSVALREQRIAALRNGATGKLYRAFGNMFFDGETENEAMLEWREANMAALVDDRGDEFFEPGTAIFRRAGRPPRLLQ